MEYVVRLVTVDVFAEGVGYAFATFGQYAEQTSGDEGVNEGSAFGQKKIPGWRAELSWPHGGRRRRSE